MTDEIYQQQQCQTCLDRFPTNDELRAHLEGYRAKESFLVAELAKCRAHSSQSISKYDAPSDVNDGNDDDSRDNCDDEDDEDHGPAFPRDNDIPRGFRCPYRGCKRFEPFNKRKRLRRHFAIHVRCQEVCVYCFRVSTLASQYIAHASSHRDGDRTKDSYISQVCDGLRKCVEEELDLLLGKKEYLPEGIQRASKKRASEVTDTSSGTPEARRAKTRSDDIGEAITASSHPTHFQDLIGAEAHDRILHSTQSAITPTPLSNSVQQLPRDSGLVDVSVQAFHPGTGVPNESYESYGAPVFWNMTFPPYHAAEQFHGEMGYIHSGIAGPPPVPEAMAQGMPKDNGVGTHTGAAAYYGQ